MRKSVLLATGLCGLAAGCGGGSNGIPTGVDGPVVFQDSLADNHNGWIDVPQTPHRNGRWDWNEIPSGGGMAAPDALRTSRVPAAVSVGVNVQMRRGAALRVVSCHEDGASTFQSAYELGIDGRRALIRELQIHNPPRILVAKSLPVANGRRVRLVGRCVPDGGSALALTLLVDGKVAAQARTDRPLPNGGVGLHALARPDSHGPAALTWDHFVVRKATSS